MVHGQSIRTRPRGRAGFPGGPIGGRGLRRVPVPGRMRPGSQDLPELELVGAPASMTAMRAVAGRRQMTTSNVLAPDAVCWMALAASSLVSSSASSAAGRRPGCGGRTGGRRRPGRMAGEDAPPGPGAGGPANRAARSGARKSVPLIVMTRGFPSGGFGGEAGGAAKPGALAYRVERYATALRIRICFRKLQLQLAQLGG